MANGPGDRGPRAAGVPTGRLPLAVMLASFSLVLFELALTRVFGVVLFASFAYLALGLAMIGIAAGALVQHLWPSLLPAHLLERRAGLLALAQGAATLLATACAVWMPLTVQFAEPPVTYGERSSIAWNLLDPFWFAALLPVLAVPFGLAGLLLAAVFEHRKERIGVVYGADLAGGALGALAFVPLLWTLAAPDVAFACALATSLAAMLLLRRGAPRALAAAMALAAAVAVGAGFSGHELLRVRYAAGYSERNVTWARWTPLTRLAVHEDRRGAYLLLDNTSASEILRTAQDRRRKAQDVNRSLVYRLHRPPARVAVLAASAGPEVAVAQQFGYHDIDAIDIADTARVVIQRFPGAPFNPYTHGDTRIVRADGRSAVLFASQPYDIIQMVHANLHSSAGLLAEAWSPSLLETKEAFVTYLEHLSPDGTLSFGKGVATPQIARAAAAALRSMGVGRPARHILYVKGAAQVMLVKRRPWTRAERDRVARLLETYGRQSIWLDPVEPDHEVVRRLLRGRVMTDDRPWAESPELVRSALVQGFRRMVGAASGEVTPSVVIYNALAVQAVLVGLAGLVLLGAPLLLRRSLEVRGAWWALGYVACLGYGYLSIETVLIHQLVLYVGHPVYALTTVVLSMLLASGLGAMLVQRVPRRRLLALLHVALPAIVALGAVQARLLPRLLMSVFFELPMGGRAVVTGLLLAPLGLVMGIPFAAGLRLLHPSAARLVPWAWALNGWMSVVAGLLTMVLSRLYGFSVALAAALAAYALAMTMAWMLPRLRGGAGG